VGPNQSYVVSVDFAEYVAGRRPALVRSAVLMGCRVEDAEDLVQVALLKCMRGWRRICRTERPDAYVYRVLVNAFRDGQGRRWQGETPTGELPEIQQIEVDLASGIVVRRALARLTKDHREVLVLRFYADLSERETAEVLGVATGTVKSRTARALAALSADQNIVRSG
jgi:RNA polymerase sigma-70 factor (sigma-E family)